MAGLALGLGQAVAMGVWISHPHVSQAYRQFFISRTRDCWLPDGEAAQSRAALAAMTSYSPGSLGRYPACYLLMKGWDGQDALAAFSVNEDDWLDLPPPAGARRVTLSFAGLIPRSVMKIRVWVDGRFAGEVITPQTPRQASITLQVPDTSGRDVIISLKPHELDEAHGIALTHIGWGF
jgi:hypothetical protein